jgi:hypothetical protein
MAVDVYLIGSYEFATNEVINVVQSVNLETLSTEAGNKDFIAVATSVHRGEDLAVRGAVSFYVVWGGTQTDAARMLNGRKHIDVHL